MKTQINLLPPPAKKQRMMRIYQRRVGYVIRRVLVAFVVVWLGMALIWWVTNETRKEVEADLQLTESGVVDVEQEVREINSLLGAVRGRVGEYQRWTLRVQEVLTLMPEEASVQILSLREDQVLTIQGVSSSRAAIVEFQGDLEGLSWIGRVEAPLRNFAAGPQGEFSFTLFPQEEDDG